MSEEKVDKKENKKSSIDKIQRESIAGIREKGIAKAREEEEKDKSLKGKIASEKEKMSKMDTKKRLKYFKDYYLKWTIVIVALVVCAIYYLFNNLLFPKTYISSGCGVNLFFTDEFKEVLGNGYKEYIGDTNKRDISIITDEMFITFGGQEQKNDGYSMEMMLYSQVAAEQINYFVIDQTGYDWLRYQELCVSLDDVLSPETIEKLEQKNAVVEDEIVVDDDVMETKKFAINLNELGYDSLDHYTMYLIFTIASPSEGYEENFTKYLLECSDSIEN